MPRIKEISKSRRIPKEKQSSGSGESIDDEDTELDDEFIKMRKLLRESQDQKFIRRLKKKLKESLSKQKDGESSEPSSDTGLYKVEYPDPLPKIDKNKNSGALESNSKKKNGSGGRYLSHPFKKIEGFRKAATDKCKDKFDQKSALFGMNEKKNEKTTKHDKKSDGEKKNSEKPKKEAKEHLYDYPLSKSDRDLTKGEVEAMIRMVLKQSREEGGGAEDLEDVSFGETESSPSEDELDVGKDPEMSSTPDDISGESLSDSEDKNLVY